MRKNYGFNRFFLLASTGSAMFCASTGLAERLTQRDGVWPQSYTGRLADPAIRYGQLPNGLRFAILHNATPPGQMALRLYIGSGSLAEDDRQRGLAHLLEHMAFRGSAHLADGELAKTLSRYGLTFGADTNAATSHESTVYQFDFPKAAPGDIDTGLMLFREIAGNLTLSKAAVDAERGVVLSEERLRDTPGYRLAKAQLNLLLPDQLASRRWPIGDTQVIRDASAEQLREFYDAQYRPDNAVIVAVGDFDPAVMEAKIRQRFGDWKARGKGAPIAPGAVVPRPEQVELFTEPGAPQTLSLSWVRPYDDTADIDAREDRDDVRLVAAMIFNNRLRDISQRPGAPFVTAQVSRDKLLRSADVTSLQVLVAPDHWQAATKAVIDEQQRLVRFGVSKPELDRVKDELRSFFAAGVAGASTRETTKLAALIVQNVEDRDVVRSPAQDQAEAAAIASKLDVSAVDAAARDMFTGSGPLLLLSSPTAPAGGEPAVRETLDAALRDEVAKGADGAQVAWPYPDVGPPGRVVDRKEIADLGVTTVRFANGTTLTIKQTSFSKDQVSSAVAFGGGRLGLPPQLSHAYWLVDGVVPAFVEGGTSKLAIGDVQRLLEAHTGKLSLVLQDRRFVLVGQGRSEDLGLQLGLSHAYLADPSFRSEAVDQLRAGIASALPQVDATATGVLNREKAVTLHGGDERWMTIPTASDVAATRSGDMASLLRPALQGAASNIVVVGDIGVDQAIALVAKGFGTVGSASPANGSASEPPRFPAHAGAPIVFHHHGRADQAFTLVAWPTKGFFESPADARALVVAGQIIRQRLIDKLREADGATYSPQIDVDVSTTLPHYGYLAVGVETPPDKVVLFRQRLDAIIADMRRSPVSADELERARAPLVEKRLQQQQNNEYWLTSLSQASDDPRIYDAIRTSVSGVRGVTAENVEDVVRRYLASTPTDLAVLPGN